MFVVIVIQTQGQDKWSLSFEPGINVPTTEFVQTDLKTGYGGDVELSYHFTNFLSVYSGWGWHHFTTDESFLGSNIDIENTGYSVGLEFKYPTTSSIVTYTVGMGAVYSHIEAENWMGIIIGDTGHTFGPQVEAGISIDLGRHIIIKPFGRYRSIETDLDLDQIVTPVTLAFLTFGASLSYTF